jgi:hypothetical protein
LSGPTAGTSGPAIAPAVKEVVCKPIHEAFSIITTEGVTILAHHFIPRLFAEFTAPMVRLLLVTSEQRLMDRIAHDVACELTAGPNQAGCQEEWSDWNPHGRGPSSGGAAHSSAGLARRFAALRLSIHRRKQHAGNRNFADLAACTERV